jgi:hypothetical protein
MIVIDALIGRLGAALTAIYVLQVVSMTLLIVLSRAKVFCVLMESTGNTVVPVLLAFGIPEMLDAAVSK